MDRSKSQLYNLEIDEALLSQASQLDGLSTEDVLARLKKHGRNELTSKKTPLWRQIVEPFTSYFVIVIIGAALLSVYERQWFEAIIISVIVVINAMIYYFQQFAVNRVLKTLRDQDKLSVNVVRNGADVVVASEELVPGDIVHVVEGMKVSADGRLVESNHIQLDESALTGESLPVHKHAAAIPGTKAIYDQENMIFKGTYVKSGSGLMLVTGTGNETQLGSINTLAAEADDGKAPIEQKIDDITKKLLVAIGAVSVVVFMLAIVRGIVLDEALKFTLSLIVSAVPEGLPVAITLVLLFSARRMAKHKALVKKISAMETLGAVTLIATDKTGTLTKNKLSVADTYTPHAKAHAFHETIRASLNGDTGFAEDPLDQILHHSIADVRTPRSWRKVKEFPFNQQLRLSGTVWRHTEGYVLHIKGAPEQVLSHCKPGDDRETALVSLQKFTGKGYRTIGFAHRTVTSIPEALTHTTLKGLKLDGFVALSDQIRQNVSKAIAEAHEAGIKVIMLTGDHVETAGYIASRVGIITDRSEVADSSLLAHGSPTQVRSALKKFKAFGRVLPEHKYALLKATKNYEITAMTGDGVNDIPALVEADIGFAMGSGTSAAKDASDVILMNNNFHTIMHAVRAGRTVLANIRKMVVYLLGTNGGEVLTMLSALLIGVQLPITAVMVLWINLVTDGFTVIPLGLSPSETHQMKHPPRDPRGPLLDGVMLTRSILLAVVIAVSVVWIFILNLPKGLAYAQTAAFLSLIVIQWANAFNMNYEFKSWLYNFVRPNWALVAAIAASIILNGIVFMTPIGEYFGVVPIQFKDAVGAIIYPMIAAFVTADLHKLVCARIVRRIV